MYRKTVLRTDDASTAMDSPVKPKVLPRTTNNTSNKPILTTARKPTWVGPSACSFAVRMAHSKRYDGDREFESCRFSLGTAEIVFR